ncbi:TQO small subunit DoxD [Maricaulis sp.]|uniref:TQO small subunit DoxD n=1 Tax=Maricaulis sp. TaxID=1486257 RepID=UPI002632A7AA|nr:TQO small subunit DoxD [Maricaulis sp.]
MDTTARPARAERFMPDWLVGGLIRLSLAPGLWLWGRAHAGPWPEVMPDIVHAADVWSVPVIAPVHLAQFAVWGAQICAALLVLGFLTRLAGVALLLASWIYGVWVAPEAWPMTVMFAAMSFYLFARGGGGLSIDGAIVATTR